MGAPDTNITGMAAELPSYKSEFVQTKSLCNRRARLVKFRLDEHEHLVYMMCLYGTTQIDEYISKSEVFEGLTRATIRRLQSSVLSVTNTTILQGLQGLNMFRFAVYNYIYLLQLKFEGREADMIKDGRVVNSFPRHNKAEIQRQLEFIKSNFAGSAELLAEARQNLASFKGYHRMVPALFSKMGTIEKLSYLYMLLGKIKDKRAMV